MGKRGRPRKKQPTIPVVDDAGQEEPQTKSHRVRDYLTEHPTATTGEVVAALQDVSAGLVSNIRFRMKQAASDESPEPEQKQERRLQPKSSSRARTSPAEQLIKAVELLQACGGISEAREMLEAAEEIRRRLT